MAQQGWEYALFERSPTIDPSFLRPASKALRRRLITRHARCAEVKRPPGRARRAANSDRFKCLAADVASKSHDKSRVLRLAVTATERRKQTE